MWAVELMAATEASDVIGPLGFGATGTGQQGQAGGRLPSFPQQHEPSGAQQEAGDSALARFAAACHPAIHGATTSPIATSSAWMNRARGMSNSIVGPGPGVRAFRGRGRPTIDRCLMNSPRILSWLLPRRGWRARLRGRRSRRTHPA